MAAAKKKMSGKKMEMSPADMRRDKGKKEMPVEFMEYGKKGAKKAVAKKAASKKAK